MGLLLDLRVYKVFYHQLMKIWSKYSSRSKSSLILLPLPPELVKSQCVKNQVLTEAIY
jgi:hypothetical protein